MSKLKILGYIVLILFIIYIIKVASETISKWAGVSIIYGIILIIIVIVIMIKARAYDKA